VSDHAILGLRVVIEVIVGVAGLVILGVRLSADLKEAQRLTRAVAGLVYQESDTIRRLLEDEP